MKFVVTLKSGLTIEPIYDPIYANQLFTFYSNKFANGEISKWEVVYGQGANA